VVKFPIVQEYSYFDALPLDLKKLLMLYFSVHNIRKLCDLPMFSAIYNNEDFWYKLFLEHFTSRPKINTNSPSFRGWRSIYLYFTNMFNKDISNEELILRAFNANGNCMEKKIVVYIKDVKDIYFVYYVIMRLIDIGDFTFPIVKAIMEEKHLDWVSIYQYGREHYDDMWQFENAHSL